MDEQLVIKPAVQERTRRCDDCGARTVVTPRPAKTHEFDEVCRACGRHWCISWSRDYAPVYAPLNAPAAVAEPQQGGLF